MCSFCSEAGYGVDMAADDSKGCAMKVCFFIKCIVCNVCRVSLNQNNSNRRIVRWGSDALWHHGNCLHCYTNTNTAGNLSEVTQAGEVLKLCLFFFIVCWVMIAKFFLTKILAFISKLRQMPVCRAPLSVLSNLSVHCCASLNIWLITNRVIKQCYIS